MSLTRQRELRSPNPASKFVEAKCAEDQGHFQYYKKSENKGEKGEYIKIDFSKKGFFILDYELVSIRGYDEVKKMSIYSNEIRCNEQGWNNEHELTVMGKPIGDKQKPIVIAKGSYNQVKETATNKYKGKFTRCVYAMSEDGELIHISMSGGVFSAFKDAIEDNRSEIHERWVRVKEWKAGKKGSVKFMRPVFEFGDPITAEEYNKAAELDTNLQEYLDQYMERGGSHLTEESNSDESQTFDIKQWRKYSENGNPALGVLSVEDLMSLKLHLEERGDIDSLMYECVSEGVREFTEIVETESWKQRTNAAGKSLEAMSIAELKEALGRINSTSPAHPRKFDVQAAIDAKEAEAGPSKFVDDDDDDNSIPF